MNNQGHHLLSTRVLPWLSLTLLVFFLPLLYADNNHVVQISDLNVSQKLAQTIGLLEDRDNRLRIDDVSTAQAASQFQLADERGGNIGFTQSTWWVRLQIRNGSDDWRHLVLRQDYPLIDYLDLYEPHDGAWKVHATGDRLPFAQRDIAHHEFLFDLKIPAHSERTYYLRYQSQGPIDISLSLYTPTDLMSVLTARQTAYGFYYGCVIMLLFWSVLIYAAVRDRVILVYFSYVASFGLYMSINNGLAFEYLWPESPQWANMSLPLMLSLSVLLALQFARMILSAEHLVPRLNKVAIGLQVVAVLGIVGTPVLPYSMLIIPVTMLIFTAVVLMLIMGALTAWSGSLPARYFLMAWGAFLLGSVVYLSKVFGWLPHNFFTQHGWQIGSLLETILLSVTLSARLRELRELSRTDALTQIGNRRLFDDSLPRFIQDAQQKKQPLSLLVIDIDHFKQFNDRHGHACGDQAIRFLAQMLRHIARRPALACRYGGEEFVLVLPNSTAAQAMIVAERLRSGVANEQRGELSFTISIGVAELSELDDQSTAALFSAADMALYASKHAGRNVVTHYQATENRRLQTA